MQDTIRTFFGPAVLVLATDDAETICLKNDLTFVELLRPFSRTTEARKNEPFVLRFFGLADLTQASTRAAQRLTGQQVAAAFTSIEEVADDKAPFRAGGPPCSADVCLGVLIRQALSHSPHRAHPLVRCVPQGLFPAHPPLGARVL